MSTDPDSDDERVDQMVASEKDNQTGLQRHFDRMTLLKSNKSKGRAPQAGKGSGRAKPAPVQRGGNEFGLSRPGDDVFGGVHIDDGVGDDGPGPGIDDDDDERDDRRTSMSQGPPSAMKRRRDPSSANPLGMTPRRHDKSLRSATGPPVLIGKYKYMIPAAERGPHAEKPEIPDVETVCFLLPSDQIVQSTGDEMKRLRDVWQESVVKAKGDALGRIYSWLKAYRTDQCLFQALNKAKRKTDAGQTTKEACDTCKRMRRPCISQVEDRSRVIVLPEQGKDDAHAFDYVLQKKW